MTTLERLIVLIRLVPDMRRRAWADGAVDDPILREWFTALERTVEGHDE